MAGCWIYKITNIQTNKVYIGQTVRCYKRRFREHMNFQNKYNKSFLKNSVKHHGVENFTVEPIFYCFQDFSCFEFFFIESYKSVYPNGYNMIAFDTTNRNFSEKTRKRMSKSKQGRVPWNKNLKVGKTWNKGVHNVNGKKIIRVCLETSEIQEYPSSMEAVRDGFNSGHIIQCCKGKLKQHKGYKWYYKEELSNGKEI